MWIQDIYSIVYIQYCSFLVVLVTDIFHRTIIFTAHRHPPSTGFRFPSSTIYGAHILMHKSSSAGFVRGVAWFSQQLHAVPRSFKHCHQPIAAFSTEYLWSKNGHRVEAILAWPVLFENNLRGFTCCVWTAVDGLLIGTACSISVMMFVHLSLCAF